MKHAEVIKEIRKCAKDAGMKTFHRIMHEVLTPEEYTTRSYLGLK